MGGILNDDYIRALLSTAPASYTAAGGRRDAVTVLPIEAQHAVPSQMPEVPDGMSPDSQKFFTAWKSWRGDRILPRRAQVQLTSIARLMPRLVVLEVRGPDRATFRLAGDDIERAFGLRLTGRSFIKMAEEADQARRGELLWRQVSQPCAVVLQQILEYRSGRRELVEIASAPVLPDADGMPLQVFAVVSPLSRQVTAREKDAVIRNIGRKLRFLDIGAGIPAQA